MNYVTGFFYYSIRDILQSLFKQISSVRVMELKGKTASLQTLKILPLAALSSSQVNIKCHLARIRIIAYIILIVLTNLLFHAERICIAYA